MSDLSHEDVADLIMGSENMMWLVNGSNHMEIRLEVLRAHYQVWLEAGGTPFKRRKHDNN